MHQLLSDTAARAARYLSGISDRRVAPLPEGIARLAGLGGPPQHPRARRGSMGRVAVVGAQRVGRSDRTDLPPGGGFAEGLRQAGYAILNEVVLNQVLVSFGDAATTRRVVAAVQSDGTCWCGGTVWQGHVAMRIGVSCWATTEDDIDRSPAAIVRIAQMQASA